MTDRERTALIVLRAFDDLDHWSPTGRRSDPDSDGELAAVLRTGDLVGGPA